MFNKKTINRKKDKIARFCGYKASLSGAYGKKKRSLVIMGAKEIVRYITNKIVIDMEDFYLDISGDELKCITYTGGAVEIKGDIKKIVLSDSAEGEEGSM